MKWLNYFSSQKEGPYSCYSTSSSDLLVWMEENKSKKKKLSILIQLQVICIVLILICLGFVLFRRDVSVVVLRRNAAGQVWVTQPKGPITATAAATRANIARYVRLRESYAAADYARQYRLVNRLSTPSVALAYRRKESPKTKRSLASRLGREGIREIKIEDIVLFPFDPTKVYSNKQVARPYGEVHFKSFEFSGKTQQPVIQDHRAILSWNYHGLPSNMEDRLTNWMGFRVYSYRLTGEPS